MQNCTLHHLKGKRIAETQSCKLWRVNMHYNSKNGRKVRKKQFIKIFQTQMTKIEKSQISEMLCEN